MRNDYEGCSLVAAPQRAPLALNKLGRSTGICGVCRVTIPYGEARAFWRHALTHTEYHDTQGRLFHMERISIDDGYELGTCHHPGVVFVQDSVTRDTIAVDTTTGDIAGCHRGDWRRAISPELIEGALLVSDLVIGQGRAA